MFRSAVIILAVRFLGKCAILFLFLSVQIPHGAGDLPQGHLGNIADGGSQDSEGFWGIKVVDTGKVLNGEIVPWVNAASGQHHIGHAVFQQALEPYSCAAVIQFLQQTARFDIAKVGVVVAEIIFNDNLRCLNQTIGKIRFAS